MVLQIDEKHDAQNAPVRKAHARMFDHLSASEGEALLLCMEVREDIFQSLVAPRHLRYKKTFRHVQPPVFP